MELILKLNYIRKNKINLDPLYCYWDTRLKSLRNLRDILNNFPYILTENSLQHDILRFLGSENYDQGLILISALTKADNPKNYIPEISDLEERIPFTNELEKIIQRDNTSEIDSEVFILTRETCWPLFLENFELTNQINITYMRYKNNWRFSTSRKYFSEKKDENDLLQIEFEFDNSLACMCFSKNNLTVFKFKRLSLRQQRSIIELFSKFDIVAETKRNIHIVYIPNPGLDKSLLIPLRDIMMTGEFSRYIITNESDKTLENKKRSSFIFCGTKITIPKSDVNNEIYFKISENATYLNSLYYCYFLDKFVTDFYRKKDRIVEDYGKENLIEVNIKKLKKTKLLVDSLRREEPSIFGDIYTQDCQFSRQPYIVDDVEDFQRNIPEKFRESIKNLLLEFPDEEFQNLYPEAKKRYYACIGRPNIKKSEAFPFPRIQKKPIENIPSSPNWSYDICEFLKKSTAKNIIRGAPCCYKLLHEEVKDNLGKNYKVADVKIVLPRRIGSLQNYLASFTKNEDFYRYGIEDFSSLLELLDKKNEEILTIENLNQWSFNLGINLILYETFNKFSTLILKIIPTFINRSFEKFVLFTKNASGSYEMIKTKNVSIQEKNIISDYVDTFLDIFENERLVL
jgi:hypothetical protein